jgi:O-antigen/teichoic acid export membrane protein
MSAISFRFLRRYASFAAARLALVAGRWGVLLLASQRLGTAEFAAIAAALSLVELLRALADGGTESYIYSKLGARHQRFRVSVRAAMQLRALLGFLATVIGMLSWLVFGGDFVVLPMFLLIFASSIQSIGVALLQKDQDFHKLGMLVIFCLLGGAFSVASAAFTSPSNRALVWFLIAPDVGAAVVATSLSLLALKQVIKKTARGIFRSLTPAAGKLIPSALVPTLAILYSRLDVFFVLPVMGIAAQAGYSVAFRLVEPVFLLLAIGASALLAELGGGSRADALRLSRRVGEIVQSRTLLFLIGLSFVCGAVAWLFTIVALDTVPQVSILAAILALVIPIRVLNAMHSALLQRLGRFDLVLRAALLNTASTFVLAAVLCSATGLIGVAAATVIGEIINSVYQKKCLTTIERDISSFNRPGRL